MHSLLTWSFLDQNNSLSVKCNAVQVWMTVVFVQSFRGGSAGSAVVATWLTGLHSTCHLLRCTKNCLMDSDDMWRCRSWSPEEMLVIPSHTPEPVTVIGMSMNSSSNLVYGQINNRMKELMLAMCWTLTNISMVEWQTASDMEHADMVIGSMLSCCTNI